MGIKHVSQWSAKKRFDPDDHVSSHSVDQRALYFVVAETVVEVRGVSSDYRPGDVLKSIQGQVFHR